MTTYSIQLSVEDCCAVNPSDLQQSDIAEVLAQPSNLLTAVFMSHPEQTVSLKASKAASDIEHIARYDVLLALPDEALVCTANSTGNVRLRGPYADQGDFFSALQAWQLAEGIAPQLSRQLPFQTGWFVYTAYEAAGLIEPTTQVWQNLRKHESHIIAQAVRCHGSVIWDHQTELFTLQADSEAGLTQLTAMLLTAAATSFTERKLPSYTACTDANARLIAEDGEQFKRAIDRIKQYIIEGDVFQVNLSRGWELISDQPIAPEAVYRALCEQNPAPFAAIARVGEDFIISSSPERLIRGNHEVLETRPIAGTRPRGASFEQDNDLQHELLQHPKERAEHIMLIDLERNDLGRVCESGSVHVNELMTIESYAHVHHIVSNVRGTPVEGLTFAEALAAVFPGGTITGCPKIRCMQIIAELEQSQRGAYTGMLAYLDVDGRFDSNILIRTLVLRDNRIGFRAGAGIVADSDPTHELAETEAKARGMLFALQAVFGDMR